MIVIASNRQVNPNANDHTVFGDDPNSKGLDELRMATAQFTKSSKKWKVDLLPEKANDVETGNPPSRQLFQQILEDISAGKLSGNWVLFVHGFNQSFLDNLTKCQAIKDIYKANVLAFSWPSNQGGFKPNEYKKARAAARGSTNAFDRMLEKLGDYLALRPFASDCAIHLNLMCYSMGNYVFENFVRSPVFAQRVQIFENIVLTQADADVRTHTDWVDQLALGKRVYITINENDSVLKWSDVVNPPRLGNTARHLTADGAVYFDFTDGRAVGDTHGIFYKTVKRNKVVKDIFTRALTGGRAERADGIELNPESNAYELLE